MTLNVTVYTQYDLASVEIVRKRFPAVRLEVFTEEREYFACLGSSDITLIQKELPSEAFRKMQPLLSESKSLRWLHWGYTGLDKLMPLSSLEDRLLITNSKGVAAPVIADYVIMVLLMLHREVPLLFQHQMKKVWRRWPSHPIRGKTVGIMGLGNIGREVARRAHFFGMNVIGLVRRPVFLTSVKRTYFREDFESFLAASDVVVVALPLTNETKGLIDKQAFHWMKPGAYLINVSRGHIVDEHALLEALKSGQLAGAAMDNFAEEPLPSDSGLWSQRNVIVTPHISGWSDDYPEGVLELFCENLERYQTGESLVNVVKLGQGY